MLALTLVIGLAVGLGAARLLARDSGPRSSLPQDAPDQPTAGSSRTAEPAGEAPAPPEGTAPPISSATTPEAAVSGFLTAEALQDYEASYEYLTETDRATYPTAARWTADHGSLVPIASFTVEEATEERVTTLTGLRSMLDPVLGLVPARARSVWPVVEEGGGWRVRFLMATMQPLYPSDEGVAAAARTWLEARQDCRTEAQTSASLLGAAELAEQLCDAEGEVAVDPPGVLTDGTDTTALLNAYGPEAFTWARAVEVRAPVPMRLVLAPVDDEWVVAAILLPAR